MGYFEVVGILEEDSKAKIDLEQHVYDFFVGLDMKIEIQFAEFFQQQQKLFRIRQIGKQMMTQFDRRKSLRNRHGRLRIKD